MQVNEYELSCEIGGMVVGYNIIAVFTTDVPRSIRGWGYECPDDAEGACFEMPESDQHDLVIFLRREDLDLPTITHEAVHAVTGLYSGRDMAVPNRDPDNDVDEEFFAYTVAHLVAAITRAYEEGAS